MAVDRAGCAIIINPLDQGSNIHSLSGVDPHRDYMAKQNIQSLSGVDHHRGYKAKQNINSLMW